MNYAQSIMNLAQNNNGLITSAMVAQKGYPNGSLKYLADSGKLEKIERGIYCLPDSWEDDFFILQSKYKRGIFSLNTALFLLDLSDRTPEKLQMTFPLTYNISKVKNRGVLCNRVAPSIYDLGIETIKSPFGNEIRIYGKERTLCDILKSKNHCDIGIITNAFKFYCAGENKNISLLSEYAEILKVEKKVRAYLEVLL